MFYELDLWIIRKRFDFLSKFVYFSVSLSFNSVEKQETSLLTVLYFHEFFVYFYKHWLLLAHKFVILGYYSNTHRYTNEHMRANINTE